MQQLHGIRRANKIALALIILLTIPATAQPPPTATASNKLSWVMDGPDLTSVQGFGYKWYLDNLTTGNQFNNVVCNGSIPIFNCEVQFPVLTQGNHVIRVSASNVAGEGPLSDPFAFVFVGKPDKPTCCTIK